MSFILPDLVIESTIRDGLADLYKNPDIIDNIFASLLEPYNRRKYGAQELEKLRTMVTKKQINVVHSFGEIGANVPCFSIQLGADTEAKNLARLEDFDSEEIITFTNPDDLAALVVINSFIAQSYDPASGQITVLDSVNVDLIHKNLIFVDGNGDEFTILSGQSNVDGSKFFTIEKNQTPDLNDFCLIKSSLDYTQHEVNSVTSDENLLIGVHAKDALTAKYMYILLKFFMVSRKKDLIKRGFIASSFSGSDFTRNMEYQGDLVFNRFFTVTGKIEDSWKGDDVTLIDDISVEVLVPKDEANAETLDEVDLTVKPTN